MAAHELVLLHLVAFLLPHALVVLVALFLVTKKLALRFLQGLQGCLTALLENGSQIQVASASGGRHVDGERVPGLTCSQVAGHLGACRDNILQVSALMV